MLKKNKLRYNEYYDMQHIYDELYAQSKNGNNFYKLLEIIGSEQNICLAYRNLKSNSGSKTAGTDGMTIDDIKQLSNAEIVATVRESLSNYRPKSVRRVFIPKAGSDKMRPLGIPCIWDRLVQQCILQVLEPICEPSTCCYIAVLPVIVITTRKQDKFLSGVIFSFFYGFCGIFLADGNLINLYPMTTGLVFSNYAHDEKVVYYPALSTSVMVIIFIGTIILLKVFNRQHNDI